MKNEENERRIEGLMKLKGLDRVQAEWLNMVLINKPEGNPYLDCKRGVEVTSLMLNFELNDFNWHRGDADVFWIDVQMCVKYKLSDEEILFMMKQQPGTENYKKHSNERNAYAEMMRGLNKLRLIISEEHSENSQRQTDLKLIEK